MFPDPRRLEGAKAKQEPESVSTPLNCVMSFCATVVYSLGLQPVLAFVGGIEFDIMPAPIAEATLVGIGEM